MKVDKLMMKRARRKAREFDSERASVGFRGYLEDLADDLRFAHMECDNRELAKEYLKAGKYDILKKSVYGLLGLSTPFLVTPGVLLTMDGQNDLAKLGAGMVLGYVGICLGFLGMARISDLEAFRRTRAIPEYKELKTKAGTNRRIVETSREFAVSKFNPKYYEFSL